MSNNGKALGLILSVALGALPAAAAHSTSLYVGNGSGATLKQTIDGAQAGDTIIVGPGTYTTPRGYWVSRPLHIISEKGPSETIIANRGYCVGVGGPCYGSFGFYLYGFVGNFTIKGFTFRDHFYGDYGLEGQGICVVQVSGTISGNVFSHNIYGVEAVEAPRVIIENNLFQNNSYDGVMISSGQSAEIRFNTFASNFGSIWLAGSAGNAVVRNNIMVLGYRGIVADSSATFTLSCNDIWGSVKENCYGLSTGCIGVDGNISVDPLFCNGYYLHQGSPCLGANTPSACGGDYMGCYPVACEVAVQGKSWGNIKSIFK
ncbi:MAG: right-handed parallel beta-helix repeat-containing protein [Candidatus Krumholzibacteriaceae bacterium]|jgi:hypothetical protein